MIWDHIQQLRIDQHRREQIADQRKTDKHAESADERFAALALVTHAMWELVKDSHSLDDIDLANKMEELDLRDGWKDHKVTAIARPCPSCQRKTSPAHRQCLYCSAENPNYSPFAAF